MLLDWFFKFGLKLFLPVHPTRAKQWMVNGRIICEPNFYGDNEFIPTNAWFLFGVMIPSLLVVDCYSKMAHFILCSKTLDDVYITKLFFKEVVCLHGLLKTIVSDWDVKFMSYFWRTLWRMLNMQLMFSSFHLQIDGQREAINRSSSLSYDQHLVVIFLVQPRLPSLRPNFSSNWISQVLFHVKSHLECMFHIINMVV